MLKEMIPMRNRIRKLRWGVAGLGRFSEQSIIPALIKVRRAKIISVYSGTPERARYISEKAGIHEHFSDYTSFLQSPIDAVYIGSANHHHFNQVIQAAEAGKHVFCDKPLALTSAEAAQMVETCKKNNVFLAVNYVYRFHPLVKKAKELIANQTIGSVISMDAHFNMHAVPDTNFRFTKEMSGGGAMRDLGTHIIDLFRYLHGEMLPLFGCFDNVIYKSEVEDFASAMLRFEQGGYAYLNVSTNASKAFNRVEIIGSRGTILIENLISQKNAIPKMSIQIEGEARKAFRKRTNKLQNACKSITLSFLNNEEPLVTGLDGLINMQLMEALEQHVSQK
ncbi:MAG: Gfo/Idh/MocA family oxidoreductase [Ignavibacteria bacterium]|nr:Gfo/Idh/MocA family oxidoreductase [Ignavibacteria bacterium]